jgi:hypothetical protein
MDERVASLKQRLRELNLSAEDFRKTYGERAPEKSTLEKLLSEDKKIFSTVGTKTLDKVEMCLDLKTLFYDTYHALRRSMIEESSNEVAQEFVGDYNFFRSNNDGVQVSGGIRMFGQHGIFRFWHYVDFADLQRLREGEKSLYQQEGKSEFEARLRNWKRARYIFGSPQHQGYFFVQHGKIILVGLDSTYFRTIMGPIVPFKRLKSDPLKVMVLGIQNGGGIFSAKSVMYHHTNAQFGKTIEDADLAKALDSPFLSASRLTFGG